MGPSELVFILAVTIVILLPRLKRHTASVFVVAPAGLARLSAARLFGIFCAGAVATFLYLPVSLLLQGNSLDLLSDLPLSRMVMGSLRGGASWVIVAALLWRTPVARSFVALIPAAWILDGFVHQILWYFTQNGASTAVRMVPGWDEWVVGATNYPAVMINTASALALAWLAMRRGGAQWSGGGGFGGVPVSNEMSDATRYLAAAAFQGVGGLGDWLRTWLGQRGRAVPPEVGVDVRLVAEVAEYARWRRLRQHLINAGLALVALVGMVSAYWFVGVLAMLAAGVIWYVEDQSLVATLKSHFLRDNYQPDTIRAKFCRPLDTEQTDALPDASANLTVYSGFSPFVGAGIDLGGWSFAIATDKGRDGLLPAPFQLNDIYEAVGRSIERLQLSGVTQRDHFFVNGQDVRADNILLPDIYGRPVQCISEGTIERYRAKSDARVRHYKWIHVRDWGGELGFSYFLRCSLRGPTLFVEVKRFLLTPLNDGVRTVDGLGESTFGEEMSKLFVAAPLMGLVSLISGPFALVAAFLRGLEKVMGGTERARRRIIDANPRYDYGVHTSLRLAYASGNYDRYFQRADSDYYQKILEKEVLDTLVEFLDAHQIETSDLKDRQSTILNHGVIVQGGNIEAGSLAVGQGAKSVQARVKKLVGRGRTATAGG